MAESRKNEKMKNKKNNKNYDLVYSIKEYISIHINEKISVLEIAEHLNKNASYINARFKLKTGLRITEYIQRQKIAQAKSKLIETDNSITEIWTNLAYYDQSHFIRHFKRETGLTPLQFRILNSRNSTKSKVS
ncbi:MAG: helix-turn-helix transcriptional regulator [Clostridiales bacterium]|nr:helix-turn-helix transcriptional regulator [Clostridiales bacterium]